LRLVAGGWFVLREKYCWLVADKPSEQVGSFFKNHVIYFCYGKINVLPGESFPSCATQRAVAPTIFNSFF
jgi:hypothetical protein